MYERGRGRETPENTRYVETSFSERGVFVALVGLSTRLLGVVTTLEIVYSDGQG